MLKMRYRRIPLYVFILLSLSLLIIWLVYLRGFCLIPVNLIKLTKVPIRLNKNICLSNDTLTAISRQNTELMTNKTNYRYITLVNFKERIGNLMFQIAAVFGVGHALRYKPYISPLHPLVQYFEIPTSTDMLLTNTRTLDEEDGGCDVSSCCADIYLHNVTLRGFFQSWKYFHNIAPFIRELFTVRPFFLNKAKRFLSPFKDASRTVIGVHVRRGDFVTNLYTRKCGYTFADIHYIHEAMSLYRRRYTNAIFIIISDDMTWCKKNVVNFDVMYSDFTDPILDLALMSLCDHMVITGGTFGWWGAWLSGGDVVYLKDFPRPGSWLDVFGMDKVEYYPPHWIGLNSRLS